MKNNLGEKIRKIRELKGYSQEYMASKLGVSQRAYSMLEHNEKISWDKVLSVAGVLEIEPADLVSFDDQIIFNNCTQAGFLNGMYNNYMPEKLIEQYEERIKGMETEIAFLRKMLEEKKK